MVLDTLREGRFVSRPDSRQRWEVSNIPPITSDNLISLHSFHYLSNSPYEIFGVLRDYLKTTGFPPGSIRLKEYGGGSSLLGGLWESAASRKRGGAEEILRVSVLT